jgi:hypothetical protein
MGLLTSHNSTTIVLMTEIFHRNDRTEGIPLPHNAQGRTIYLSDTANGTTDGSLTLMAQQMATGESHLPMNLPPNPAVFGAEFCQSAPQ